MMMSHVEPLPRSLCRVKQEHYWGSRTCRLLPTMSLRAQANGANRDAITF